MQEEKLWELLTRCLAGDEQEAIKLLEQSPALLNEPWNGELVEVAENLRIHYQMTPLHAAARGGSEGVLISLLRRGANLHSLAGGWTALFYAARAGQLDAFKCAAYWKKVWESAFIVKMIR